LKYYEKLKKFYKRFSGAQFEKMMESLPEDQKNDFIRTEMLMVQLFAVWMLANFLAVQLPNTYTYIASG
jgi:hypothetical protein